MVLDPEARVLASAGREFPQSYPQDGWVEHQPEDIWQSVHDAALEALRRAGVRAADCLGIGITNQRETTLLWERESGRPIHPAIVWQDRRSAEACEKLKREGHEAEIRQRTGLLLDPYFSATKIAWMLDELPGCRERAEAGALCFGTVDSYLLWRLSGGRVHATDPSNAARTLLYDLHLGAFSPALAQRFRVPMALLPELRDTAGLFGHTQGAGFVPDGIPIAAMAGDQSAALFGQTCFRPGEAKCTYGTGAFLLVNTGEKAVLSKKGLLTSVAWSVGGRPMFFLEGSAFIAGAAIQWLRDGLGLIRDAAEVEALAAQVPDAGGLSFVPALVGLGAPYWDPNARGLLTGITRDTQAAHVARAVLEGVALQITDLSRAMQSDWELGLQRLRVDGGAARNDLLMQFQADVCDLVIDRPLCIETTALGAAYLAGLGLGVFRNLEHIREKHRIEKTFSPAMDAAQREAHLQRWSKAVAKSLSD